MPTVKAFIRTTNKEKAFVNVRFRLTDGRQVQMFHKSDIQVNPNDFDPNKETIKAKIIFDSVARKQFNNSITDRKALITDIYTNAPDGTDFTTDWLEIEIDKQLHPEKYAPINEDARTYLLAYIDEFIKNAPQRKVKKQNTFVRESTIKSYRANRNRVEAFLKHSGKDDVLLSEVDNDFFKAYQDYLTIAKRTVTNVKGTVKNEVRQYTNNTIGDALKSLKSMLTDVTAISADLKKVYVLKEEVDNIYLTETELQQLKDYDFSGQPYLDRARDRFLCLAWTCSRISDIGKINKIQDGMIRYSQQKTGNKVVIPLHPVVAEILKKYNDSLPEISDQKFNDYIKTACKMAGIDSPHTVNRTIGGKTVSETAPKYSFVSSHTGRRSFCTNMYLRGLDTLMIMSISGHKTEAAFLRYIKVSPEQHAERMAQKWSEIYK